MRSLTPILGLALGVLTSSPAHTVELADLEPGDDVLLIGHDRGPSMGALHVTGTFASASKAAGTLAIRYRAARATPGDVRHPLQRALSGARQGSRLVLPTKSVDVRALRAASARELFRAQSAAIQRYERLQRTFWSESAATWRGEALEHIDTLRHVGLPRPATALRYRLTYAWINRRWTGSTDPWATVPALDYRDAVERATSPAIFERLEQVLRAEGDLEPVRRALSRQHGALHWDGRGPRDERSPLPLTQAMAVGLIGQACRAPLDTFLTRPLELGRSWSMPPEGRLSGGYRQPTVTEARAVLRPAYTRCMAFITASGEYLPAGIALSEAIEQRVDAHIARALE